MNHVEKDLIISSLSSSLELRRLYQQHEDLDDMLKDYSHRVFLSEREQSKIKEYKLRKLKIMEHMLKLVKKCG